MEIRRIKHPKEIREIEIDIVIFLLFFSLITNEEEEEDDDVLLLSIPEGESGDLGESVVILLSGESGEEGEVPLEEGEGGGEGIRTGISLHSLLRV